MKQRVCCKAGGCELVCEGQHPFRCMSFWSITGYFARGSVSVRTFWTCDDVFMICTLKMQTVNSPVFGSNVGGVMCSPNE